MTRIGVLLVHCKGNFTLFRPSRIFRRQQTLKGRYGIPWNKTNTVFRQARYIPYDSKK